MQNSVVVFTFAVLDQKYSFWENLVQNIKIANLSCNLVPRLIRICSIQWYSSFNLFRLEIPFLGKIGPKDENCQFKLKFGNVICSVEIWSLD